MYSGAIIDSMEWLKKTGKIPTKTLLYDTINDLPSLLKNGKHYHLGSTAEIFELYKDHAHDPLFTGWLAENIMPEYPETVLSYTITATLSMPLFKRTVIVTYKKSILEAFVLTCDPDTDRWFPGLLLYTVKPRKTKGGAFPAPMVELPWEDIKEYINQDGADMAALNLGLKIIKRDDLLFHRGKGKYSYKRLMG